MVSAAGAASAELDWENLGRVLSAYAAYPSTENAAAALAALPGAHVGYDRLADHEAIAERIHRSLPMVGRQVEARDAQAVRLALALFSVTDGAAAEELQIMLGKLIRIDPVLFLRELGPRLGQVPNLPGLLGNHGPEFVDRMRARCLEASLRIEALESVGDPGLARAKERCISVLRQQRTRCE